VARGPERQLNTKEGGDIDIILLRNEFWNPQNLRVTKVIKKDTKSGLPVLQVEIPALRLAGKGIQVLLDTTGKKPAGGELKSNCFAHVLGLTEPKESGPVKDFGPLYVDTSEALTIFFGSGRWTVHKKLSDRQPGDVLLF